MKPLHIDLGDGRRGPKGNIAIQVTVTLLRCIRIGTTRHMTVAHARATRDWLTEAIEEMEAQ